MTTRIRKSLFLVLTPVLLFGAACNQTNSVKNVPAAQDVQVTAEVKENEVSRIKQLSRGLLDMLENSGEAIAGVFRKTHTDTTLLQEDTVAAQTSHVDITQKYEENEKNLWGPHVTALSTGVIGTVVSDRPNEFSKLSDEMQRKFRNAGLGGERGWRNGGEARQLYRQSIPRVIRDMGEDAVWKFLDCQGGKECTTDGKHWSHIVSNKNDKSKVKNPANGVWENGIKNKSRGEKNMTPKELIQIRLHQTKDVTNIIHKNPSSVPWARYAKWGGGLAMVAEAPIATAENFFHWKYGRKSLVHAIEDTAISIAISTGMGLVYAAGFIVLQPIIGSKVIVALAVVGGIIYIGSAVYRIAHAANSDLNWSASLNRLYNTALKKGTLWSQNIGDLEWLPIFSR